jgi:acyl-CoA synthetase (AMP-forming)/AMP-acid ligase II
MYHTGGLNVFTLPLLMLGGRVILPRRFDPAQALRLLQTFFASARIADDQGNDVPDGGTGELLLAGPHVCAGYWRRPDATAEAIRDGWFYTGEIARRDSEGFYYIVDRKKDMIITGGENVYPTEVSEFRPLTVESV